MSVGSRLASPENLELVKKNSWKFGRPLIIDEGMRYYQENPSEVELIASNLERMGLKNTGADLDDLGRACAGSEKRHQDCGHCDNERSRMHSRPPRSDPECRRMMGAV